MSDESEETAVVEQPPEHPTHVEQLSQAAATPIIIAAAADKRAVAGIRRAKGIGGLAGFGVTAMAAHMHGELMTSMLFRALLGGISGYMVAWAGAVTVWRRILRAEIRHGFEVLGGARASASNAEMR